MSSLLCAIVAAATWYIAYKAKKEAKEFAVALATGRDHRTHPALILASAKYLTSRIRDTPTDDKCNGESGCKMIEFGAVNNIKSLLARASLIPAKSYNLDEVDDAGEILCKDVAASHGAAFELLVTANFHLRNEKLDLTEYTLKASQDQQNPAVWKIKDPELLGLNKLNPDHSTRHKEDMYERKADISIQGRGNKKTIVELKSYPISVTDNDYKKNKQYYADACDLNTKMPLWNSTKIWTAEKDVFCKKEKRTVKRKYRRGTTMHRQLILDYILTLKHLNQDGSEVVEPQVDDLLWIFQDWKVKEEKKRKGLNLLAKKINEKVGVSMASVRVEKSTDFGLDYIAKRLSWLGPTTVGKKEDEQNKVLMGRDRVAFNLGIPQGRSSNPTNKELGPLFLGEININEEEIVPLKDRVKRFKGAVGLNATLPLDTNGLTVQQQDDILDALGIKKGTILYEAVTSEVSNPIEEHIELVEKELDELTDKALEYAVGEENARKIENVWEHIDKTDAEFEDAVRKYFPEIRNPFGDDSQCS